ncbi:hypothetical protein D3C86_1400940 [compost metagenome]
MLAVRRRRQLLAQLADEDVDDLQFGLVHAAVQVVQEHFLGQGRALAEREQLQHLVFLAGQVHAVTIDLDRLGVQVHGDLAGVDDGLGVTLGATDHGVGARDQLVLVEGLGQIVVGAAAEGLDLGFNLVAAREDHDRRIDLADAQLTQNLKAAHVGQVQVQQNEVVVIDLAQIDAFFTQVGRIDVKAFRLEHQFDALGGGVIVFNQQDAHSCPSRQSLAAAAEKTTTG